MVEARWLEIDGLQRNPTAAGVQRPGSRHSESHQGKQQGQEIFGRSRVSANRRRLAFREVQSRGARVGNERCRGIQNVREFGRGKRRRRVAGGNAEFKSGCGLRISLRHGWLDQFRVWRGQLFAWRGAWEFADGSAELRCEERKEIGARRSIKSEVELSQVNF